MADKLSEYRRKRDPARTPEPVPDEAGELPVGSAGGGAYVVQEHHARALHWDFRLERDGVLVSWAVPKGLPVDPKANHLAVQTEDHPLDYAQFEGAIPAGEYGGGQVRLWDRGTFSYEKWTEHEVKFTLTGQRLSGRYVLINTKGKNWIMHRMDPAPTPDWVSLPSQLAPMLATPGVLPPTADDDNWGYETKWDGARAIAFVDGGRVRLMSRNDNDVTVSYPELRAFAATLGTAQLVLDGEIVAFGEHGRPSFSRLQKRMHVNRAAEAQRLAETDPVRYLIFDVLYRDGVSTVNLPYTQRRALLESLDLNGDGWQTPPYYAGGGAAVLSANRELGLEGIVAKRLTSDYRPGRRSADWLKIKNIQAQEVVICGWKPGRGRRAGTVGSLLLGIPERGKMVYVGKVGTGFTDRALDLLLAKLQPLARKTAPFSDGLPKTEGADARWVTPKLTGEVVFSEWTPDGRLRHPVWRGLRLDKDADRVRREE